MALFKCLKQETTTFLETSPPNLNFVNIFFTVGLGPNCRFNDCQYFRLYGTLYIYIESLHVTLIIVNLFTSSWVDHVLLICSAVFIPPENMIPLLTGSSPAFVATVAREERRLRTQLRVQTVL